MRAVVTQAINAYIDAERWKHRMEAADAVLDQAVRQLTEDEMEVYMEATNHANALLSITCSACTPVEADNASPS